MEERAPKDQRMGFYLDTPTRQELEKLSQASGAPMSELLRRGIGLLLKRASETRQCA